MRTQSRQAQGDFARVPLRSSNVDPWLERTLRTVRQMSAMANPDLSANALKGGKRALGCEPCEYLRQRVLCVFECAQNCFGIGGRREGIGVLVAPVEDVGVVSPQLFQQLYDLSRFLLTEDR